MKRLILFLVALCISGAAYAQLNNYQPGFRTIDGSQLNKMVAIVNNLTGQGTPQAVTGTTGTFSSYISAASLTLGGTAYTNVVQGATAGIRLATGATALDGTNPTSVASGLTTIVACTTSIMTSSALGVGTSISTYAISGTTLNLYGWKVTATGDTTLVASSGTETIGWICSGT